MCLCVCVFMIIIHVELLWYNEASWGASAALNLCCPSSFIKHTQKCMQARPQTHKHTQIRQISNLPEQRKHKHTTPRTLAHVNIQFRVAGLLSGFLSAYTQLRASKSQVRNAKLCQLQNNTGRNAYVIIYLIQHLPLLTCRSSLVS